MPSAALQSAMTQSVYSLGLKDWRQQSSCPVLSEKALVRDLSGAMMIGSERLLMAGLRRHLNSASSFQNVTAQTRVRFVKGVN